MAGEAPDTPQTVPAGCFDHQLVGQTDQAGLAMVYGDQNSAHQHKVAVLLVTPDFITSDFIHEYELGPLLKEAKQGGVRILWVPVRASSYKKTVLKDYQAVVDPDKPLANMTAADRDPAWVKICAEIEKAVSADVTSRAAFTRKAS